MERTSDEARPNEKDSSMKLVTLERMSDKSLRVLLSGIKRVSRDRHIRHLKSVRDRRISITKEILCNKSTRTEIAERYGISKTIVSHDFEITVRKVLWQNNGVLADSLGIRNTSMFLKDRRAVETYKDKILEAMEGLHYD